MCWFVLLGPVVSGRLSIGQAIASHAFRNGSHMLLGIEGPQAVMAWKLADIAVQVLIAHLVVDADPLVPFGVVRAAAGRLWAVVEPLA